MTVTVTAPAATAEPEQAFEDVRIRVDESMERGSAAGSGLLQVGSVPVEIAVATIGGGVIEVGDGPVEDLGLDMPDLSDGEDYPRAVVGITAAETDPDPLAPGEADFTFSADFRLDSTSVGAAVDNGDNILQRGLASDRSQFKLEIGGGRPRCRVAGSEGAVDVALAGAPLRAERWYHAECSRQGDVVTLAVATYLSDGSMSTAVVSTENGPTGALAWPEPRTPISVGGKLAANGHVIRSATDQFNGLLANPVLDIQTP